MGKQFVRRVIFAALGVIGIAGTVVVTAPSASAAPAAGSVVRLCNHGRGYKAAIEFTDLKHLGTIAPGKCSKERRSIAVGKLVFLVGFTSPDHNFEIGSYKVPRGSYEVDTFGNRATATFRIVHQ